MGGIPLSQSPTIQGLVARIAAVEPLAVDVNASLADILAYLIALNDKVDMLLDGGIVVTPTPVAAFSVLPAITTDGTPQVGEIAAFDFGTISNGGQFGLRQLRRADDTVVTSDGAGSYQWTVAGDFYIYATIAGTNPVVSARSATITVAAAAQAGAAPAPTLSFPTTNDDGTAYADSSNPPVVVLGIPESLDKTTFRALLYYDRNSSGALSVDAARTLTIDDLMAAGDSETATFARFKGLAAGSFRAQAVFQNKTDGTYGPLSAILSTTLAAEALPPATTTYDPASKSSTVALSDDRRTMTANVTQNEFQCAAFTASRSDARYWEITQVTPAQSDDIWGSGIMAPGTAVPTTGFPSGAVPIGSVVGPAGDTSGFLATPATLGNTDGTFKIFRSDGTIETKSHGFTTYTAFGLDRRNAPLLMNTGQEPFKYPGNIPATAKRYN